MAGRDLPTGAAGPSEDDRPDDAPRNRGARSPHGGRDAGIAGDVKQRFISEPEHWGTRERTFKNGLVLLELFSGSGHLSAAFARHGWSCVLVENNRDLAMKTAAIHTYRRP